MKNIIVLLFLTPFITLAHPLKMSFFNVKYTPETDSVFIELRAFSNDMSDAIKQEMQKEISFENWTGEYDSVLNEFIKKHTLIKFGDKQLNLEFYQYDYDSSKDLIIMKYQFSAIPLKKGDKVILSNRLLIKQYGPEQVNIFRIQIPQVANTTVTCFKDYDTQTFIMK